MKAWAERHQVLAVSVVAGLGFILWQLRSVCIALFAGYILASALRPAVDWLNHFMPRALALLITYVALLSMFFGLVFPMLLMLGGQTHSLLSQITNVLQSGGYLGTLGVNALSYLQNNAVNITASALSFLADTISTVIISVYLLYDWHDLHHSLARRRGTFLKALSGTMQESDRVLGSWVRGQLLLSAVVGLLVFIAMLLLGIPYAPVLGAFASIAEFIPYAGPFIAAAPAVLIALNTSLTQALIIAAAYTVIQQLENHFLVPIIMRRSVNLHPVVVIAVMLAGFELLGLAGIILAVPLTALARITVTYFWYA